MSTQSLALACSRYCQKVPTNHRKTRTASYKDHGRENHACSHPYRAPRQGRIARSNSIRVEVHMPERAVISKHLLDELIRAKLGGIPCRGVDPLPVAWRARVNGN